MLDWPIFPMQNPLLEMNVLACQRGARRRYAVPRLLEDAGVLSAFYTDSSVYSPLGKIARFINGLGMAPSGLQSLASRNPAGVPREKVFSTDRLLLSHLPGVTVDLTPTYRRWGLQGAAVVYSMYGEEIGFLEWAKKQGAKIVVDVIIHPLNDRIVSAEQSRLFPQMEQDREALDGMDTHSKRVFSLADRLLCPSDWVAEGVCSISSGFREKIQVVPYGSSLEISRCINEQPQAGRILFVGREPMRKGLHYLAEAAHLVRQAGADIEVRAAGITASDIEWMKYRDEINCLGTLPMEKMRAEFEQADIFVLPSLSEGQAGVLLEAMACGCPVVATRESGVDFESGCGVTVPSRNADVLAKTITEIVGNRTMRNELAKGALRQAATFSLDSWKQRLVEVVQDVGNH